MKHCTQCGEELIRFPKRADRLEVMVSPMDVGLLGSKYNPETGYRQFGIQVRCPNWKWWKLNSHTCYTDENSLHDSDLQMLIKK